MQSFSKPTNEIIDATAPLLSSPHHERYFFKNLNNPNWIEPLKQRGFFDHPPTIENIEGGGVRYPYWPPGEYLARMAEHLPKEVADIFASIETKNPSVLKNIFDAANKMPEDIAARLVHTICKAIEVGALGWHFSDATDLCVKLASKSQDNAAMKLAYALFTLRYVEGEDILRHKDRYWYIEGLKKIVPLLTRIKPNEFIHNICKWICAAIRGEGHVGIEFGEDYSRIWRPAIEEHHENQSHDLASGMVGFLRQALEQAITENQITLEEGLKIIEKYPYSLFKRMHIHLINYFAERNPELARDVMLDIKQEWFDKHDYKYEYAVLVERRFSMLLPEQRKEWFDRIEAGPDMSHFNEFFRSGFRREPTEADRLGEIYYWQYEKLHWIREYLDGKWKDFYQKMFNEKGEPEFAYFDFSHGVRWGWDSPFTLEELEGLSFDELITKVSSWQPGELRKHGFRPEIEGLANVFGQYVSSKAEELSGQAEMLKNRPAIYIRTFIEKMIEALKTGQDIDLGALLRLCKWVIEKPVDQDARIGTGKGVMIDKDWQWTCDAISWLIREVCVAKSDKVPRYSITEYRNKICDLLGKLTHAPAKSYIVDEDQRKNPKVYDFLTSAINSPRGKAVDALLEYARWVANLVKYEKNGRQIVPDGFNCMSEVREILEWQIAPQNGSFESFSIIGADMGLLYWIDKEWVKANASRIFDLKKIEQDPNHAYGWAAWNTFLDWVSPHIEFYKILKQQYAYAVQHLSEVELANNSAKSPLHHLGEHLVILYGRGDLKTHNDEQLIYDFLQKATTEVRSKTMEFVGHSLDHNENISEDIIKRFMELWDFYWPKLGQKENKAHPRSGLFGEWFTCKKFPEKWCLDRLEDYLKFAPTPDFAEPIVKRLVDLTSNNVEQVTRILDLMVRADKEGWRVYCWHKEAKKILKLAMQSSDNVKTMAEQLIDYLGRHRGYIEFGELLNQKS